MDDPTAPLKRQLHTMARYHRWASERLMQHVDALPQDDYQRDAGLFFRSVHGTLNHLLVAEQALWWRRFAEGVSPRVALDTELEADRARVRDRLLEGAAHWAPMVQALTPAQLLGPLHYTTTKGVPMALPYAATLAHVFNHGTHHRGQVSAALTAMGHACPELDLVWMLQEEAVS